MNQDPADPDYMRAVIDAIAIAKTSTAFRSIPSPLDADDEDNDREHKRALREDRMRARGRMP
jgi:hypothetical protein